MTIILTDLEQKALAALQASSSDNGHDFGIMEEVEWKGSRKQLGALVTTLQQKGVVIEVAETIRIERRPITQFVLADAYCVDPEGV